MKKVERKFLSELDEKMNKLSIKIKARILLKSEITKFDYDNYFFQIILVDQSKREIIGCNYIYFLFFNSFNREFYQ